VSATSARAERPFPHPLGEIKPMQSATATAASGRPNPWRCTSAPLLASAWHDERAAIYKRLIGEALSDDDCGAFLLGGDPSLYDSTLRIIDPVVGGAAVENPWHTQNRVRSPSRLCRDARQGRLHAPIRCRDRRRRGAHARHVNAASPKAWLVCQLHHAVQFSPTQQDERALGRLSAGGCVTRACPAGRHQAAPRVESRNGGFDTRRP
jgi:hypothetical protein